MEKRIGIQASDPEGIYGEEMIIFGGTKKLGGMTWLVFFNENEKRIEIPVDARMAKHFEIYFERLSPSEPKKVESPAQ